MTRGNTQNVLRANCLWLWKWSQLHLHQTANIEEQLGPNVHGNTIITLNLRLQRLALLSSREALPLFLYENSLSEKLCLALVSCLRADPEEKCNSASAAFLIFDRYRFCEMFDCSHQLPAQVAQVRLCPRTTGNVPLPPFSKRMHCCSGIIVLYISKDSSWKTSEWQKVRWDLSGKMKMEMEEAFEAFFACCTCHLYVSDGYFHQLPTLYQEGREREAMLVVVLLLKSSSSLPFTRYCSLHHECQGKWISKMLINCSVISFQPFKMKSPSCVLGSLLSTLFLV